MKEIPKGSIDLVITSPPYWGLRDYGEEGQLGLEPTMEAYLDNMMLWVKEVWRVLKPTGSFVLNIGDTFCGSGKGGTSISGINPNNRENQPHGWDWNLKDGLYKPKQLLSVSSFAYCRIVSETDFVCRGEHIWAKPNVPSPIRSRLKHSHEKLFWFVKDVDKYYFDEKAWLRAEKETSKKRTERNTFSFAGGINLSPTSCSRGGHDKAKSAKEGMTIEHSWRIVPVGEKQKGFELVGRKNIKQFHIAPFPEKLIAPYIQSLCPEYCTKCGQIKIYKTIRIGKKIKRTHIDHGHFREQVGDAYDNGTPATYKTKAITCSCNAGFFGGTVLDPFVGSGTAMKIARDFKRSAIGIDLSEKCIDYTKKRLNWKNGIDGNEYVELEGEKNE